MHAIDLNADMGEYADADQARREAALMGLVSSCSIACGGHAGDVGTMETTVALARDHGVAVGAHPSYPDKEHFGRRSLKISNDDLKVSLESQLDALQQIMNKNSDNMRHVKPHGALYNDAARDEALAEIVVTAAAGIAIFGPPGSALEVAARKYGNHFIAEGFVDRRYQADGSLTPRSEAEAVIADIDRRAAQALALARKEPIITSGGPLRLDVATLCIHSDSQGAVETARKVRAVLERHQIEIKATQRSEP